MGGVTLADLSIIISPGPVVILKCGIFMAQDGAMAAPILPFKKTEAGWKCMPLTHCEKNCLFTVHKGFYDIIGITKTITLWDLWLPRA